MPASSAPAKVGALRVLYVEDDPMLRDMLATQLRTHRRIAAVEAFGSPREVIDGAGLGIDVALDLRFLFIAQPACIIHTIVEEHQHHEAQHD